LAFVDDDELDVKVMGLCLIKGHAMKPYLRVLDIALHINLSPK
jgi:hypothetical protein